MKKLRLTAEAVADLTEIFDYIAGGDIDAAQRVAAEIHDEMKKLAGDPGLGHKRSDLTSRDLLFWRVYSYLIVYQPGDPVNISRCCTPGAM
jgi:plasmid stabilization system protein ParE